MLNQYLVLFLLSGTLAHAEDTGVFPHTASVAETHSANPSDALLYQLKE